MCYSPQRGRTATRVEQGDLFKFYEAQAVLLLVARATFIQSIDSTNPQFGSGETRPGLIPATRDKTRADFQVK